MASVVVVGASLGGLAAAARLARQRHDVRLLDRAVPGEAGAGTGEPASLTLPAVYRDLFRKTGHPLEPEVRLVPAEPARRYLFPDGRVLDLPTGSRKAMLDAFGMALGTAAAAEWDGFVTSGGARWRAARHRLKPDGEPPGAAAPVVPLARLRDPANRLLRAWYAADAGLQAGLDRRADPGRRLDLAVLPYLEQAFGAWQVEGGVRALVAATAQRARRCGAVLVADCEVVHVVVRDGAVRGVRTADGSAYEADVVVDAVGLPGDRRSARPAGARPGGPVTATVHLCGDELLDLPAETVLLSSSAGRGVVLSRPDIGADPTSARVRAVLPAAPAGNDAELARHLLATLAGAGIQVRGEVIDVSVRPVRRPGRGRWWTLRPDPSVWLDLRAATTHPDVGGLVSATPQIAGALAVPWQGLAAALAASSCGTVPRRSSRSVQ